MTDFIHNIERANAEIDRLRAERAGKAWEVIDEKNQEIEQLRSQLEKVESENARNAAHVSDLQEECDRRFRVEQDLQSELEKAKVLMQDCVDLYHVASGKTVTDEGDGYGPLREMRLFLTDDQR